MLAMPTVGIHASRILSTSHIARRCRLDCMRPCIRVEVNIRHSASGKEKTKSKGYVNEASLEQSSILERGLNPLRGAIYIV
jgi:hypothetical protein